MRKLDWKTRHAFMSRLKVDKVTLHPIILAMLGPDEHLEGECTGVAVRQGAVIVAKDMRRSLKFNRPAKKYRQMTINHYFLPARRIKPRPWLKYRQLSLHHFFKQVK